jgi:hypothetical protein
MPTMTLSELLVQETTDVWCVGRYTSLQKLLTQPPWIATYQREPNLCTSAPIATNLFASVMTKVTIGSTGITRWSTGTKIKEVNT